MTTTKERCTSDTLTSILAGSGPLLQTRPCSASFVITGSKACVACKIPLDQCRLSLFASTPFGFLVFYCNVCNLSHFCCWLLLQSNHIIRAQPAYGSIVLFPPNLLERQSTCMITELLYSSSLSLIAPSL